MRMKLAVLMLVFTLSLSTLATAASAVSFTYEITASGTETLTREDGTYFYNSCKGILWFGCSDDDSHIAPVDEEAVNEGYRTYDYRYELTKQTGNSYVYDIVQYPDKYTFKTHVGASGNQRSEIEGTFYVKSENTVPWSDTENGSSSVSAAEGSKYITTSTLNAPNQDTTWSVTDNSNAVLTWMNGSSMYACEDSDSSNVCDYLENPGSLVVSRTSPPYTTNVSKGSEFTLSGNVMCFDGFCGEVTAHARYNASSQEADTPISGTSGSTPMYTTTQNSVSCGQMSASDVCPVSWSVMTTASGSYKVDVFADSSRADVQDKSSPDATVNVVPGNMSVSASLNPDTINVSGTSLVSGIVSCSSADCGTVSSLLSYDGVGLLVSGQNPQVCTLSGGSQCQVSWTVNGTQVGNYALKILVTSDETGVEPVNSSTMQLSVVQEASGNGGSAETGSLSFPSISMDPPVIETGQSSTLTTTMACSTDYCGSTTISARYDLILIGASGGITTSDTNPHACTTLPCTASWQITGNTANVYSMEVFGESNESSVSSLSIPVILNVTGPVVPQGGSITVNSPADQSAYSRGDTLLLSLSLTTQDGPVTGASVSATSPIFSTALYDDGLHSDGQVDDGVYANAVTIPQDAEGSYVVSFATPWGEQQVSISVSSQLEVRLATDQKSYYQSDVMKIVGYVLKSGEPADAQVSIHMSSGDWRFNKTVSTAVDGGYLLNYPISFGDPVGDWVITATASDAEGNSGENSTTVSVGIPPGRVYYNVVILSPLDASQASYSLGELLDIKAEVTYSREPVGGAQVTCKDPLGNDILLEEKASGIYSKSYTIPMNVRPGIWSLTCQAEKENRAGGSSINVNIKVVGLQIEVISPQPVGSTINLAQDQETDFIVSVRYPNGTLLMNATVYMDIHNKTVLLKPSDNYYMASYRPAERGLFVLNLVARDSVGNSGKKTLNLVVETPRGFEQLWIYLLVGAVIAVLAVLAFRVRKPHIVQLPLREVPAKPVDKKTQIREKLTDLRNKHREIQQAREVTEREYYKRRIDEGTFRKLMESYEQQLIEIEVEIRSLEERLRSM